MYREKKYINGYLDSKMFDAIYGLAQYFHDAHKELYLVGGCVRDMLLDKKPHDYDMCTNATPEEIKEIFRISVRYTIIETGIKHGTLTIHDRPSNIFFEITTFRIDGKYDDNRHPTEVIFTPSLEEDLKRRDFTINSFAYDLHKEELVMLDKSFLYDLQLGIIRTVGDPAERYKEDALRMLRAIRFASQLNFSLEKDTYLGISLCGPLLKNISKERIRDELTKILLSDNPQYLEMIVTTDIERYLFDNNTPLTNALNCEHQNPWHYTDVFHHTIDVVKASPKTFISRWSALFHDLGKPAVKALKPGTTDHYRYIGHPEASTYIADNLMNLLKFSNDQKEIIHKFVLYHDYPLSDVSDKKFKLKLVDIGEEHFLEFLELRKADGLAHKLNISSNFAINAVSICKDRYMKYLMNPEPMRLKDLAINGDDLKELGIEGKDIGKTLTYLLSVVLDNPNKNTRECLMKYARGVKYENLLHV